MGTRYKVIENPNYREGALLGTKEASRYHVLDTERDSRRVAATITRSAADRIADAVYPCPTCDGSGVGPLQASGSAKCQRCEGFGVLYPGMIGHYEKE